VVCVEYYRVRVCSLWGHWSFVSIYVYIFGGWGASNVQYNVMWKVNAVSSPCRAVPSRAGPRHARCYTRVAVNTSRLRCHGDDSTVLSYYVTGRCWAIVQ
jgi:hypothetical protein